MRSWHEHLPVGVDPADVDLVAARSLPAAWRDVWAREPDQVVLRDDRGAAVIAAELEERTTRVAGRLAAAGVVPGDRVVLTASTTVDFVVTYVGVLRLGAIAVPLNRALSPREVAHVVGDARPRAAVVDADVAASLGDLAPPIVATPDLAGLPATPRPDAELDGVGSDDPALLVYTSGTTGVPKGVVLRHGNLLASAEAVRLAWRWTGDDELVLSLPLFHVHGLGVGLHGTLLAGGAARLLARFDADTVLDAVRHGSSMFFGVPTMWHRLAAHPDASVLARLRLGVSGSAPLPADLHTAIAAVAGRAPLERYGMTETLMLVSNPHDGERRAGSVGFPLPGVEVRLTGDWEDAAEIEVRGANVFAGYWERPDATEEAFRDGWFRTGDLGAVDPDGYLRIVGRAKELIITGGFNVYPREVEDVLRAHPAVEDVAVVGVPDPEWGELVVAAIVPADTVHDDELSAWCADRLAPYKRPRRWARVDALPRNALGKVQRHELKLVL